MANDETTLLLPEQAGLQLAEDPENSNYWNQYTDSVTPSTMATILENVYCGLAAPLASWQIIDGTFSAVGSPDPINSVNGIVPAGMVAEYDGIWPPELRPASITARWCIALLGGLATTTLYWKVQPVTQANAKDCTTLKHNLAGMISKLGAAAIISSIPGSVLSYIDTIHTSDIPDKLREPIAIITTLACAIVTIATYKRSLTEMAIALLNTLKVLWKQPMQNKGLLIFAIILAVFSLCLVPGFVANLAMIISDWTQEAGVPKFWATNLIGVPISTLFTLPFYILVVQSCLTIYTRMEKCVTDKTASANSAAAISLALIPGSIIGSAFAFFISNGIGPDALDWTDDKSLVNIWIAALGAVPAGIAFTESSYDCFVKPVLSTLYGWGSWAYSCLPRWQDINPRRYWHNDYETLP